MNKNKFEKIVKFSLPFDKRTKNPKTNYGIGGMRIWFILKGRRGAVQVLIGTTFYLPYTIDEYYKTNRGIFEGYKGTLEKPFSCWDVGFHSRKKPSYMNKSDKQKCDIMGECYYDGSSLRGEQDKVDEIFLKKGEDGIWEYLEKYYEEEFEVENGKRR